MSSAPSSPRRSLSSLASGLALSFMFVGYAQGEAAFPAKCDSFNATSPVRKNPFSDVSQLTIKQLKDYSGWNKLLEGAKRGGVTLEGICPLQMRAPNQPIVDIDTDANSIDITIFPVERNDKKSPLQILTENIRDDKLSYAGPIISRMALLQGNLPDDDFVNGTEGFHNLILLNTALPAYTISEAVLFAVEAAAEDGRKLEINAMYRSSPLMVQEINDIHAKALVAKAQNRSLSETERADFHKKVMRVLIESTDARMSAAQVSVGVMAARMAEDIMEGKNPTAPSHALNSELLTQKISRLIGDQAAADVVNTYKTLWSNKSDDPVKPVEAELSRLPDIARKQVEEFKRMQNGHRGVPQILQPR